MALLHLALTFTINQITSNRIFQFGTFVVSSCFVFIFLFLVHTVRICYFRFILFLQLIKKNPLVRTTQIGFLLLYFPLTEHLFCYFYSVCVRYKVVRSGLSIRAVVMHSHSQFLTWTFIHFICVYDIHELFSIDLTSPKIMEMAKFRTLAHLVYFAPRYLEQVLTTPTKI